MLNTFKKRFIVSSNFCMLQKRQPDVEAEPICKFSSANRPLKRQYSSSRYHLKRITGQTRLTQSLHRANQVYLLLYTLVQEGKHRHKHQSGNTRQLDASTGVRRQRAIGTSRRGASGAASGRRTAGGAASGSGAGTRARAGGAGARSGTGAGGSSRRVDLRGGSRVGHDLGSVDFLIAVVAKVRVLGRSSSNLPRASSQRKLGRHRSWHHPDVGTHRLTQRVGQRGGAGNVRTRAFQGKTGTDLARPLGHHTETASIPVRAGSHFRTELNTALSTVWELGINGVGETVDTGRFRHRGVGVPLGGKGSSKQEDEGKHFGFLEEESEGFYGYKGPEEQGASSEGAGGIGAAFVTGKRRGPLQCWSGGLEEPP